MNKIGKKGSFQKLNEITNIFHKHNFKVIFQVLIGYPYDTKDDILSAFSRFKKLGCDHIIFQGVYIMKHTILYNMAKKDGFIPDEQNFCFNKNPYLEKLDLISYKDEVYNDSPD